MLLIDIGLIRGLAGCVYVNSWNPLRAFVVQMWSVYAPGRDDVGNQRYFCSQKIEKPQIIVLKKSLFSNQKTTNLTPNEIADK